MIKKRKNWLPWALFIGAALVFAAIAYYTQVVYERMASWLSGCVYDPICSCWDVAMFRVGMVYHVPGWWCDPVG